LREALVIEVDISLYLPPGCGDCRLKAIDEPDDRTQQEISARFYNSVKYDCKIKEGAVADAVYVERVSATEFPANREINRENRRNRPSTANATIA
jgi:hypothetical protein